MSGKLAFGAHSGPPRYLDDNEEEEFVKCLVGSARILFARRKKEVLSIVRATVAKKQGCDIDKVTVTPGYWSSFVKRHPHLSLRSGSKLAYQRAITATPEVVNHYFDLLEESLKSNNLLEISNPYI